MAATKSRSRSSSSKSSGRSGGTGGASSRSRGGSPQITQDHDEIRRWAEARGGKPACVRGTERGNSCLLRIDFPGGAGADQLAPMEWDEFFEQFDNNGLAFLYQDKGQSRFNKFVTPGMAGMKGSRKVASGGGTRGGGSRAGGSNGESRGGAKGGRAGGNSRGGGNGSARAWGSSSTRGGGNRGGGGSGGGGRRKGKSGSGGTRTKRTARRGAIIIPLLAVLALLGAIAAIHPALVSFR